VLDNDALDNDALDNDALDNDAVAPRKPGSSRAAGQVGDFHRAYGLQVRDSPTVAVGADQVELRLALIEEEVGELAEAARAADLVGVADALADIVYVAYGTAHVYGIDLDAVLDEVHASNMTKLGADGKPIRRADGKVLKGPAYRPPNIADVLLPPVPQVPSAGSPGLPST
jgi:predicted HAD superfamily Cof-like phosphohydrolase